MKIIRKNGENNGKNYDKNIAVIFAELLALGSIIIDGGYFFNGSIFKKFPIRIQMRGWKKTS